MCLNQGVMPAGGSGTKLLNDPKVGELYLVELKISLVEVEAVFLRKSLAQQRLLDVWLEK